MLTGPLKCISTKRLNKCMGINICRRFQADNLFNLLVSTQHVMNKANKEIFDNDDKKWLSKIEQAIFMGNKYKLSQKTWSTLRRQ